MKKLLLVCVIGIILCSVLSAAADPIKVAINPDTKPFKYLDENGEFAGIDAEVINIVARSQDLEIELVPMEFSEIIDAVASCEVDAAISALTLTENRSKLVSFTDPYVMGAQSVYVLAKNDDWKDISDPSIKTIGAKTGTTSEDSVTVISDMNKVEAKLYPDYESLFKALEDGEIDAAVADELLAKSFVDSYADIMTIGQPLSAEVYAIAVCPSNTELLQTLNKGLNELRRSGTLDQIVLDNLMR